MVTGIASPKAWGLFQVITVICDCHKKVNYSFCVWRFFSWRSGKEYKVKVHISYLKLNCSVGYDVSLASFETYPLFYKESNL